MTADFVDACTRHWEDAVHLEQQQRLANADHLYGMSAECALKAIMIGLGMTIRADGSPDEFRHRKHVDLLWPEFLTFANTRNGARYANLLAASTPFANWRAEQRYEPRSAFSTTLLAPHRQGAVEARHALAAAQLDGVI